MLARRALRSLVNFPTHSEEIKKLPHGIVRVNIPEELINEMEWVARTARLAAPGNVRGRHKEVYTVGRLGALTPWVRCLVESIKSYFKLGALERVQLNLDALYHGRRPH